MGKPDDVKPREVWFELRENAEGFPCKSYYICSNDAAPIVVENPPPMSGRFLPFLEKRPVYKKHDIVYILELREGKWYEGRIIEVLDDNCYRVKYTRIPTEFKVHESQIVASFHNYP